MHDFPDDDDDIDISVVDISSPEALDVQQQVSRIMQRLADDLRDEALKVSAAWRQKRV
jgi:hypothetical protein